ncbi:MAG: hypothetical protein LBG17_02990 [Bacteroidales bacterium]|jgi:hypothetical protein|nr:hypothetical protein [Bacteroidales bacterium]
MFSFLIELSILDIKPEADYTGHFVLLIISVVPAGFRSNFREISCRDFDERAKNFSSLIFLWLVF